MVPETLVTIDFLQYKGVALTQGKTKLFHDAKDLFHPMNKKSANITTVIKPFIIFACEFIIDAPRPVLRASTDQTVKRRATEKRIRSRIN